MYRVSVNHTKHSIFKVIQKRFCLQHKGFSHTEQKCSAQKILQTSNHRLPVKNHKFVSFYVLTFVCLIHSCQYVTLSSLGGTVLGLCPVLKGLIVHNLVFHMGLETGGPVSVYILQICKIPYYTTNMQNRP